MLRNREKPGRKKISFFIAKTNTHKIYLWPIWIWLKTEIYIKKSVIKIKYFINLWRYKSSFFCSYSMMHLTFVYYGRMWECISAGNHDISVDASFHWQVFKGVTTKYEDNSMALWNSSQLKCGFRKKNSQQVAKAAAHCRHI